MFKCYFRIEPKETGKIDDDEQEVAYFFLATLAVRFVEGHAQLGDLLAQLGEDAFDGFPIKAHLSGAPGQLVCLHERGEASGDAIEDRGNQLHWRGGFLLLFRLQLRPVFQDLFGSVGFDRAENVRVPANHLVVDAGDYVRDVETSCFPGDIGVEEDLEEQVTEFFGQFFGVTLFDGIQDLVGLLDQEGLERVVGLFAVPRATAGGAKAGLERD